jgi:hypothetical protein
MYSIPADLWKHFDGDAEIRFSVSQKTKSLHLEREVGGDDLPAFAKASLFLVVHFERDWTGLPLTLPSEL